VTWPKELPVFGSEIGGKSAAICHSLIETCKLNGVNPQSWLTYALTKILPDASAHGTNSYLG